MLLEIGLGAGPLGEHIASRIIYALGLYDMHGNALQFVQDCFANLYAELPTDGGI